MNARLHRAIIAFAVCTSAMPGPAASQAPRPANACLAHAPEAAARSGLPQDIIVRVTMAESGSDAHAVSTKGAMGCMQIMPGTWAMLSARYRLGSDPWDARANMIAGSLYLAELIARYGMPGALAAYNAGERRWQRYRDNGTPLPLETIAYMERIGSNTRVVPAAMPEPRWQEAALFMARGDVRTTSGEQSVPSQLGATVDREEDSAAGPTVRTLFPLSGSRASDAQERKP